MGRTDGALEAMEVKQPEVPKVTKEVLEPLTIPRPVCVGISSAVIVGEDATYTSFGEGGDSNKVMNETAVFEVGSITKVFTGLLLAAMDARGEVSLEDPLARYLPSGSKVPRKDDTEIRLIDLATHTSGLPRLPPNLTSSEHFDPQDPYGHFDFDQLVQSLAESELTGEIGKEARYSNFGFELLAFALSRAAGSSYSDLVEDRVLKPLGMNDTAVWLTEQPSTRLIPGHGQFGEKVSFWSTPVPGDGGLVSTAHDLTLFLQANFDPSSPLAEPLERARRIEVSAGGGNSHGLGWVIADDKPGVRYHWHNGGSGGYGSFMAVEVEKQRGVVLLSNTHHSPLLDQAGIRLLDLICETK